MNINPLLTDYHHRYEPHLILDARARWGYAREPVLRRMPNGDLVCLHYSGGPTEPHDQNVELITRSADDGVTWSTTETLFRHSTRGVWAPELFTGGDRPCAFVHTFDASSHYTELCAHVSFTADNGHTWTEPVSLPGGCHGLNVRQGIVLDDNTWVFPCYWQETTGGWDWLKQPDGGMHLDSRWLFRCGVLRSANRGDSFSLHGYLTVPGINLWEPNVVEVAPGRLLMLIRAEGQPCKYRSDSADGGLTWSVPHPTEIPDPNTKLTLLRVGDAIVLLHNSDATPGWTNRRTLALWVSRDGGQTWPTKIDLVKSQVANRVICYPHGFADTPRQTLYVAADTAVEHFLIKVPFSDFLRP